MHRRKNNSTKTEEIKFVYVDQTTEELPRVFYVGKGNQRRIRHLKRNKKHTAISQRFGVHRVIVFETLDDALANECEIAKIIEYQTRANGYHVCDEDFGCNFTRGGEGVTGVSDFEKSIRAQRMKDRWADPITRASLTADQNSAETQDKKRRAMKQWCSTPEGVQHIKTSLACARAAITHESRVMGQNRVETKALKSIAVKAYCATIDAKQNKSENAKKNWDSQEYRDKQKLARTDWKPSEEHKERISQKLKGHPVSDETKEKMRLARILFLERKRAGKIVAVKKKRKS